MKELLSVLALSLASVHILNKLRSDTDLELISGCEISAQESCECSWTDASGRNRKFGCMEMMMLDSATDLLNAVNVARLSVK
jgi:hypothetical protein